MANCSKAEFGFHGLVILAAHGAALHHLAALGFRDRADARGRRRDERARHFGRRALEIERRDQRLADLQFGDGGGGVEALALAERLGGGAHRFLVARREGAQGVLHAIAELPQHRLGHVERVLRDEINADALGADEAHDLLHRVEKRLGRAVEQKMRLVEEEDELGFVGVAHLGQRLEQFRKHPQQEGRVETRTAHQLVGGEDVDDPLPALGADEVLQVERRLAEEGAGALVLQHQQLPLDRAHGRGGDVAELLLQLGPVVRDELEHRPEVLQVVQDEAVLVGDAEDDVDDAFLDVVRLDEAREQQRPHFGDRGADRMALLAEEVPEHHRKLVGLPFEAQFSGALGEMLLRLAGHGDAREVALHVGGEHRHAGIGEAFGQGLQGDGLAGARGAGHKSVTVGAFEVEVLELALPLADQHHPRLVPRIRRHG